MSSLVPSRHQSYSFFNSKNGIFFLTICKNASSSCRKYFQYNTHPNPPYKWAKYNEIPKTATKVVVILRHPVERFLSGVGEMLRYREDDKNRRFVQRHPMGVSYARGNMQKTLDHAIQLVGTHPNINVHILPQVQKLALLNFDPHDARLEVHLMEGGKITPPIRLPGIGPFPHIYPSMCSFTPTPHQVTRIEALYPGDMKIYNYFKKKLQQKDAASVTSTSSSLA